MSKLFCFIRCVIVLSFLGGAFAFSNLFASQLRERIVFHHPQWTEEVEVKDSKFCKKNGDCATIEVVEDGKIFVKWDKYEEETFLYSPNRRAYIFEDKEEIKEAKEKEKEDKK